MKRNSFSSFKLIAILLSMLMFTACDKNEFTAQDALDLELQRLTREREIEAEREAFQTSQAAAAHAYRKVLDSLERVNAGGLVYYSVAVVPGGGSVFSGGRTEGVSGATVTISQFGQNVAVTTDESGIASFPDLRSGEVTVNVSIDGFTDMTYLSNLTPDGGVANNASVYVGNVVPVFENDDSNPDNLAKMANIKGRGFAELDITYGNDTEEVVPAGTTIASFIDANDPAFWAKYLAEQNEEGSDAFPGNTGSTTRKSGYIQRVSYEQAAVVARYDASGDYILRVPATGSGLPTKMRYSEFGADRTYFDVDNGDVVNIDDITDFFNQLPTSGGDADFGVVSKRFLYGPNVTATPIALTGILTIGGYPVPLFDLAVQDATVVASISNAGSVTSVTVDGTDDGLYLVPPTVMLSAPPAGGTQATAVAVLETNAINANTRLREIASFTITAAGAGYTTAPTVTITRQESGITGTVRQEVADGGLSGTVRVIDGGFGFTESTFDIITGSIHATAGSSFSVVGDWTGIDPLFNAPNGFTGVSPALTFTYDYLNNNGSNFDIVTKIDATSGGSDWTAADLATVNATPFKYVQSGANFPSADLEADPIFVTSGGALVFNGVYGTGANDIATLGLNNNGTLDLTNLNLSVPNLQRGNSYVFVPQINLVLGNATGTGASMTCTVNELGTLTAVTLIGGTGFTDAMASQIQVQVVDPSNALDAEFFLGGSGIQAYNVTNAAGNAGYVTEVLDVATSINTNPQTSLAKNAAAADEAANGNTFVALAGTPTDGTAAYGYPVWDFARKVVTGVELFDGGNNYDGLAAGNPTLNWELVPVYGSNTNWDASAVTKITAEQLVVTLTNGGSGYSTAPQVIFAGGGVAIGGQLPTNGAANPQSDDFDFWINNQGTIVKVVNNYNARVGSEFPYTVASVAADPLLVGLSIEESEAVLTNTFFTSMDNRIGIDGFFRPSYSANVAGPAAGNGGGDIIPLLNGDGTFDRWLLGFQSGNDTETTFEELADGVATAGLGSLQIMDEMNDARSYFDGLGNAIPYNAYVATPTYEIVDLSGLGSGATGTISLNGEGKIVAMNTTNGGSGFVATYITNSEYISAEGFRVLGGPDGNVNGTLEVYSGVSYARDIHYGTGQELE